MENKPHKCVYDNLEFLNDQKATIKTALIFIILLIISLGTSAIIIKLF